MQQKQKATSPLRPIGLTTSTSLDSVTRSSDAPPPPTSAGISAQAQFQEQDSNRPEDGSLDVAWDGWNQLSTKLKVIINMKQLLRNVQQKSRDKSQNIGATLGDSIRPKSNWSALDEKIVTDNLASITTGLSDITKLYTSMAKHPVFVEGRLLLHLDLSGAIKEFNHHLLPHKSGVTATIPDLMSDEVFESWYKTSEIFRNVIKNNQYLSPLAQAYNDDDEDLKRAMAKFHRAGSAPAHDVLVELVFALNIDTGEPNNCMCCFYDNIGMSLIEQQRKTWKVVLNRLSTACLSHSACVPPPTSATQQSEAALLRSLESYSISSRIVCPYSFRLIEWRWRKGDLPTPKYQKLVKAYMTIVEDYLSLLHERAMSPLNLGLRAMLVPFQKPSKPIGT